MPPAPIVVAAALAASAVAGPLALAFGEPPFATSASALVASGMIILTLVAVSGVLLARGRWARPTAAGVAAGWIAVSSLGDLAPLAATTVVVAAVALTGAIGPWLGRWVRHRPAVEGPPPAAVVALLLLLAVPVALGVTLPEGVSWYAWALSAWSLALALALARLVPGSLFALRILHAPACLAVGAAIGIATFIVVGALGVAATATAWRREVAAAMTGSSPASSMRIPPELAPRDVLDAAGADESGRPRP
ncbi:MAG TPA: hypothetical protein VK960_01665 [Acidimicrobiia bacterium]|nr:hypothetical protein [Acidimicrobiia bacterium]